MNGIIQIKTILSYSEVKFKEKSSIFLGFAYPIKSIEDVTVKLALLRKKYFDATHHCYAYKLASNLLKYSDDGEPSGTAGIRILNVIEHFDLVNVLLVVVRYYGGTKLGVGPLGKAYYNSALQVIESENIIIQKPYYKITIESNYLLINQVKKLLLKYEAINDEVKFGEGVKFSYFIDPGKVKLVSDELYELSRGEIGISIENIVVYK